MHGFTTKLKFLPGWQTNGRVYFPARDNDGRQGISVECPRGAGRRRAARTVRLGILESMPVSRHLEEQVRYPGTPQRCVELERLRIWHSQVIGAVMVKIGGSSGVI